MIFDGDSIPPAGGHAALASGARRWLLGAAASLCLLGSGCAYLTTYTKQVDLNAGSALSVDVKQRIVFSQSVLVDRKDASSGKVTATCAEPSPDALTVLGASGGLSFNGGAAGADKVVNLSGAFAENGAFVGLRTQSIQLLRDQLYRLCEGYASGAINDSEFKAMQRRFQSTVMGLLAIEQLTHPVVAGQALLLSSAGAQAGAGAADAAVTAAQQRVDEQRQKVTDAQKDLNLKKAAVAKDSADVTDNAAQVAAETAKDKDSAAIPGLVTAGKTLQTKLATDLTDQDNSALQLKKEEEVLALDMRALRQAQSRSSAEASGGGSLGVAARATSDASASLSSAVKEIVIEVNRSYTRDECLELLARSAGGKLPDFGSALRDLCVGVVSADHAERLALVELRRTEAEWKVLQAKAEVLKAQAESDKLALQKDGAAAAAKVDADAVPKAAVPPKGKARAAPPKTKG